MNTGMSTVFPLFLSLRFLATSPYLAPKPTLYWGCKEPYISENMYDGSLAGNRPPSPSLSKLLQVIIGAETILTGVIGRAGPVHLEEYHCVRESNRQTHPRSRACKIIGFVILAFQKWSYLRALQTHPRSLSCKIRCFKIRDFENLRATLNKFKVKA